MEAVCKYCNEVEHKQLAPALKCVDCNAYVHLKCLKREGTPGDFAGDVFFDFTCLECSKCGEECFIRNKISWVNVILLTINHLNIQSHGISHHGFFHYKTHIASFIDRNWQMLFGSQVKQKKNWMGTLAGTLSVYNGLIFRSGSIVLGEAGWWKLQHLFTPALASYIIAEATKDKKSRPKGHGLDRTLFYSKIRALGYIDYVLVENDIPIAVEPVAKRARLQSENHSDTGASVHSESSRHAPSDTEPRSEPDITILDSSYACLTSKNSYSDVDSFFTSYEFDNHSIEPERHESSSEHTLLPSVHHSDSDSRGSHATPTPTPTLAHAHTHAEHTDHVDMVVRRESLFSTQLNSVEAPWFEKEEMAPKDVVELTEYEEIQLLKQVEGLIARIRDVDKKAYLSRLRAKLALRRLKRHKHLPIFDLDKSVKVLGGYVTDDHKTEANVERVLDRFQRSYLMDSLTGTISQPSCGTILLSHISATPLRSALSGSALKPYIRRDRHCQPLWLRFTDELLRRTHRHIKDYEPPPHASIDYSYVRPQHIPAINNLCAQFFWPGIDLTEALQQPELSCVVTYRRLVVGCAFLVADAGRDAYLSFLLTRPRWRRAGLARFMLYHLLQTCTGKDVTLHVSPTNPAIFLYQKFGFKVEELVQDFYEKYYEIDHKGCRHALFLRLVR